MRLKICKKCGKKFYTETGHSETYLCPECSLQTKRDNVYRERKCQICGAIFPGYPRSLFCPSCSEMRKKEQKKKYNRKRPARPIGSIDRCEICGQAYKVKSGLQRFCPDCAEKAVKEKIRARKREYNEQNKKRLYAHKEKMRKDGHICVVCGKVFDPDLPTVTCSQECAKEWQRIRQNQADLRRGKRRMPAEARRDGNIPQSGVPGVSWRKNGKWQATYKRHYLGVFGTVEEAAEVIEKYKNSHEKW